MVQREKKVSTFAKLFNYLCEQNRISNVMLIVKLVKTRLTML